MSTPPKRIHKGVGNALVREMNSTNNAIILEHLCKAKKLVSSSEGKLIKSKISPEDYFINLSHAAPILRYPEVGISRLAINVCELISNLLLEDTDETKATSKIIVMIFEYYFLVGPILFKNQGARFVNDVTFMKHFAQYIKSLCGSRSQAQRELGNLLAALEVYNPIKDIESM